MGATKSRVFLETWGPELIGRLAEEKKRSSGGATLIMACDDVPPGRALVCLSEVNTPPLYTFILILLNPRDLRR